MFDVDVYSLVLLVHVTAAIALVSSGLFAPLVRRALLAAESMNAVRLWLDFGRRAARANPAASLAVLATGLYLGSAGWWTQPWFFVAGATWLANALVATLVVKRAAGATAEAAARTTGDAVTAEVDTLRRSRAWAAGLDVLLASDLALLYLMFNKPGLVESLIVVDGAVGMAFALRALLGSRSAEAVPAAGLTPRSDAP